MKHVHYKYARCATCSNMPDTCQWGGGPYAGTLLLYLQEIAVNKLVSLYLAIFNLSSRRNCLVAGF